ncbi:MAG: MobF family relaxase [Acidimicrobiales bacterium]
MTARVTTLKGLNAGVYYTEQLPSYYLDAGEPRGVWFGDAAMSLGLAGVVDDAAFVNVIGGLDPTGSFVLGRRHGEESVRAFDVTFSAPKSVSVLWGLADETTRVEVLAAHDAAVAAAMGWIERHATTRMQIDGQICVVDAEGITAALFRQHTSRSGDPQLHTHAVIANRVLAPDGRFLALDARYLKFDQRTVSAVYHAGLESELTQRLGVVWNPPVHGISELAHVPVGLRAEFSLRSLDVEERLKVKLARFSESLGRVPTPRERWRLEREAVVDSRPSKPDAKPARLAREEWAAISRSAGAEPTELVREVLGQQRAPHHQLDVQDTAERALVALGDKQSTWRPAELLRELAANLDGDLAMPAAELVGQLETLTEAITRDLLVDLSPAIVDGVALRRDGRPITESVIARVLTTPVILAEEHHIAAWAQQRLSLPVTDKPVLLAPVLTELDHAQLELAAAVAGDAPLVLAVGPAGTGKTTALKPAVAQLRYERRTVFGVAPSAAAAQVLADETGLGADTVDKLLVEHQRVGGPRPRFDLPVGTTVIVDEAGMMSTPKLAQLATLADVRHWRVVLVGDPLQFSAVGRGGMFDFLVEEHGAIELGRVHRFTNEWERDASLRLRRGDLDVFDLYANHRRILEGPAEELQERMVAAWHRARQRGEDVLMTAPTNDAVLALNRAAQDVRLRSCEIQTKRAVEAGGYRLHVGDEIVTRRNDRDLTTDRGHPVHNRDRWIIEKLHRDHSVTVSGSLGRVRLSTEYVARDVELGYAQTAHAAQGRTVDRSLTLIDGPVDARGIYVPMTRGRDANVAYVAVEPGQSARDLLAVALGREWIDRPALDVLREQPQRLPQREALLSPRALRDLWDEQRAIGRQRSVLEQSVDGVERGLSTKSGDLTDTLKRLDGARARVDDAQQRLDGFDTAWSRFRNRDTIDTLHGDIDRAAGLATEYETSATTLRAEISDLTGVRDRAVAHRDAVRPGLIDRTREIRSTLNTDASLRIDRVERDPPAYVRGLRRDGNEKLWRATVGGIEQYRVAYGIESGNALGPRPGYGDMTRADRYRELEHSIHQLTPTRARDREIDMGIEM